MRETVGLRVCSGTDSRSSERYSACLTDPFLPGPTSLTRSLCGARRSLPSFTPVRRASAGAKGAAVRTAG